MEYKTILAIIATGLSVVAFIPYFSDVLKNKTKPHIFTWLVWTLSQGIASLAQILKGAGGGAWPAGIGAFLCFSIFLLSVKHGEKEITKTDWISFICAIMAIILWQLTSNPLFAVILVALADTIGYIPTFRKIWKKPYEETVSIYAMSVLIWIITLFALSSFNPTTALYPAVLVADNIATVAMIIWRRKSIS